MKRNIKLIKNVFVPILLLLLLATACEKDSPRKIKLTAKSAFPASQEKIETIQVKSDSKKSIAILTFVNKTGRTDLDWLRKGIVELLVSDLSQSRQLDLSPSRQADRVIEDLGYRSSQIDSSAGHRVAQQLHADMFIAGRYFMENDSLKCQVELRDSNSGRQIRSTEQSCASLENVLTMVDRVSRTLRGALEVTVKQMPEKDQMLANVTTTSVRAYEQYTLGNEALNKLNFAQARTHFQKAIELDSTFASAYARLAEAYGHYGDTEKAAVLLEKAMRYIDNVPERERLDIIAMKAATHGDLYKTIETYQHITELYPYDVEAHYNLGNYYFGVHDIHKAIDEYEKVISLDPKHKLAYNQLGYSYARTGQLESAYAALKKYIELVPEEPNPYDSFGEVLARQGEVERAIEQFKIALEKESEFEPAINHLILTLLDNGDVKAARKMLGKFNTSEKPEMVKNQLLYNKALIEIAGGNSDKAAQILRQLVDKIKPEGSVIKALFTLYELYPESEFVQEQINTWISELKNKQYKSLNVRTISLVAIGLHLDYKLSELDQILADFVQQEKDPLVMIPALAYQSVIRSLRGLSFEENLEQLEEYSDKISFDYSSMISWNVYWKHYFKGLKRSLDNHRVGYDYFHGFNQFSRDDGNLSFYLHSHVALALWHYRNNNVDSMRAVLARTGTPAEFDWSVIGAFDVTKGIHEKFWPEEQPTSQWIHEADARGKLLQKTDHVFDGFVNLKEITNAHTNSCAYALLRIRSGSFKKCFFRFGTDGILKAWLNDKHLLTKNVKEEAIPDQYIITATLRPGDNWLLVRVGDYYGPYGFYFRITDEHGQGEKNISFGESELFAKGTQ